MGATYSIVAYGEDRQKMLGIIELAFEEVRRLAQMLSNYRPSSEWSLVNRSAAERPVQVSKELYDLLAACLEYSSESDGAFDISVGPLMKVWGFYKGSGHLPHRAEVRGAMDYVGYRNIILEPREKAVRFAKKGIEIDPGGIGKGYAVDRMVGILKQYGVRSAMVSGGGSSIYAIGAPPNEPRGWRVSIRNPKSPEDTIQDVFLKDQSMSTSGSYEKFFRAEGKIYSHIMDPRTGWPSQGMLSASVITPKTIDSEAWAKPFFIDGAKPGSRTRQLWRTKLKSEGFRVYLCEDRSELACAWLQ
jgi:thiamine biosynthesis lipoprotein